MGAVSKFFTTPGQSDSFAIFINSFISDLGWSRTKVSSLYSSATLLSGCFMFFVGRLIDRYGSRWVALFAAALLGFACLINSFVATPILLFIGFFLARLAGKGALELSANTVGPQWFIRRRALAIMLVGLGGTAGGIVFPLLNNYLINALGWRPAFRVLGIGIWIIYLPIAYFFFIGRPEDAGLKPDGNSTPKHTPHQSPETTQEVSLRQSQAVRTVAFWILAYCVFQSSMVGTGIILHFVSIFQQAGFSAAFAARIMSIKPIIGLSTSLIMGLLLDRIKQQKYVLTIASISQAAGILILAFMRQGGMAFFYLIVAGASGTMTFYCVGVLTPRVFGRKYIGGILGITTALNVVGSALGPVLFGAAFDFFGNYHGVLLLSSLFPLAAGVLSVFIRNRSSRKDGENERR